MDVHHLRYFVEVAHAGTIAAASRALAISASPLSRRIGDLERHMGARLFVRSGRRMELTEAGAVLLPIARRVLAEFGQIEKLRTRERRPVRVGLVPGISMDVTVLIERVLADRHPEDSVEYVPATSPVQNEKVLAGDLDIATVRQVERDPRLERVALATEHLQVVVSPALRALVPTPMRPGDLAGWTLVTTHPPGFSADLVRFLDEQGVDDVRVLADADTNAVSVLLQHGTRFSLRLEGAPFPTSAPLVDLPLPSPITAQTWLVWRRDRPDLRATVDAVREALHEG